MSELSWAELIEVQIYLKSVSQSVGKVCCSRVSCSETKVEEEEEKVRVNTIQYRSIQGDCIIILLSVCDRLCKTRSWSFLVDRSIVKVLNKNIFNSPESSFVTTWSALTEGDLLQDLYWEATYVKKWSDRHRNNESFRI